MAMITADTEERLSCGFVIDTGCEELLKDNFREDFGRDMNESEREVLNSRDIGLAHIEDNVVNFLEEVLNAVRPEGHGRNCDLVGSAWCRYTNEPGLFLITQGNLNRQMDPWGVGSEAGGEMNYMLPDHGYEGPEADFYEGVEDWIARISDVTIEFFDIADEEFEEAMEIINSDSKNYVEGE